MQDVNRLKLVLVEQKKTSKWLAEELDVNAPYRTTSIRRSQT